MDGQQILRANHVRRDVDAQHLTATWRICVHATRRLWPYGRGYLSRARWVELST